MDKQQLQHDGYDEKKLNNQKRQGSIFESLLERLPWSQSLDQGRINFQRQQEESLCRDKFRALLRELPNVFRRPLVETSIHLFMSLKALF